jgi:hypothetical protein
MQDIELILSVSKFCISDILIILTVRQIPHKVQQVMSAEKTPILSGAIPAFEMFMSSWEKLGREHHRLKALIKPGLDWASMYYGRMDRTRAYIVAMRK